MARGEEKDTIGTKVESKLKSGLTFTGLGTGGVTGLTLTKATESANNPEAMALTAGGIASIAGGAYLGGKLATTVDGQIADRIDRMKPQRFQSGEIYLDSNDPFGLALHNANYNLNEEQKQQIREDKNIEDVRKHQATSYIASQLNSEEPTDEWIEEIGLGEINGFQPRFRSSAGSSGDFKRGYIDENNEVFVQAPKGGDTFQETLERVQTWKENKEVLNQADKYVDQILQNEGKEVMEDSLTDVKVNYDFLRDNEEILREEVEGGIMTPSENYDIVVTSHEGDPFPVLVGEYNTDMIERGSTEDVSREEINERKRVLGMYLDGLVQEGLFEGTPGDYWTSNGHGRENLKNMFYDPETDTVGVTDLGEYIGETPDNMPDLSIAERYA